MKKTISLMLVLVLCMVAKGDFTFGEPTNLGPTVNSSSLDWYPSIRGDGLEMYFESNRPGGSGAFDIWVSTRATKADDWGVPRNLGAPINTPDWQQTPCISADGLELYYNDWGLRVVRRATVSDPWGEPENDSFININAIGGSAPSLSSDGLSLFLASPWPEDYWSEHWDLYVSTRPARDDVWSVPVNLGPTVNGVNSSTWENVSPAISPDDLVLFFASFRDGGSGRADLWMTRRPAIDGPWSEPVNLGPTINSDMGENTPAISADGRSLLFSSNRDGSNIGDLDIWQVSIDPVVDLNGDGNIDTDDLLIMIDNWGTDNSLCDIGPMPWGDGIVDVQDLIVLAEHLFEDYRLIAHWTLDEEDGNIAYDSIGKYDADLYGGPTWQPNSGKDGGALEFDGVDDYVNIPFILDPSKESVSAFAWIKGGAPGQVILSQRNTVVNNVTKLGNSWLWADSSYGRLVTRLMHPPFDPLMSESVITDGQWHHVGLVYDFIGLRRYLYVDGAEVAQDTTIAGGVGLESGLYIGAGESLVPSSFFSGLIDDVRIYNGVLSPEEVAVLAQ